MALGYFYHMYRNQPLLRDGGVLIITHPCSDQFDPVHHPRYIEFFNRLLPETRDATRSRQKYQDEFAYNPSYIEMYRRGNAYHGAHPFFMWYWGQRGREKASRVIVGRRRQRDGAADARLGDRRDARRGDRDGAPHDGARARRSRCCTTRRS